MLSPWAAHHGQLKKRIQSMLRTTTYWPPIPYIQKGTVQRLLLRVIELWQNFLPCTTSPSNNSFHSTTWNNKLTILLLHKNVFRGPSYETINFYKMRMYFLSFLWHDLKCTNKQIAWLGRLFWIFYPTKNSAITLVNTNIQHSMLSRNHISVHI